MVGSGEQDASVYRVVCDQLAAEMRMHDDGSSRGLNEVFLIFSWRCSKADPGGGRKGKNGHGLSIVLRTAY